MDERVAFLIDELVTHPKNVGVDFEKWRKRFQAIFAEPIDQESRVVLLSTYSAFLDSISRGLGRSGGHVEEFNNSREADWRFLCLQEAQQISGSEKVDPETLWAIVERELAAGRMERSDFTELAKDGAVVLGEKRVQKRGWLGRFFKPAEN